MDSAGDPNWSVVGSSPEGWWACLVTKRVEIRAEVSRIWKQHRTNDDVQCGRCHSVPLSSTELFSVFQLVVSFYSPEFYCFHSVSPARNFPLELVETKTKAKRQSEYWTYSHQMDINSSPNECCSMSLWHVEKTLRWQHQCCVYTTLDRWPKKHNQCSFKYLTSKKADVSSSSKLPKNKLYFWAKWDILRYKFNTQQKVSRLYWTSYQEYQELRLSVFTVISTGTSF